MKITKLKLLRLQEGLSQEQASEQLGISQGYLSQIESLSRTLTSELKLKMAGLYNVNVNDLN